MNKMRSLAATLALVGFACAQGGGANERTILVDFSHDEFASFLIANFPKEVTVSQGDTLVFKQTWTGEPHTVTGGTQVDQLMAKASNWIPFFESFEALRAEGVGLPDPEGEPTGTWAEAVQAVEQSDAEPHRTKFLEAIDALVEEGVPLPPRTDPGETTFAEVGRVVEEESEKIFEEIKLPWALEETEDGEGFVAQNAGQPCYLATGLPPEDPDVPCDESDQRQPAFDGKASYYNSGIIPYEGPQGNTFRVELADDIEPGSYFFYCAVHGPGQYTKVTVAPQGSEVPSQTEVSRQARAEIDEFTDPMLRLYRDAEDGSIEVGGETIRSPFSGLSPEVHGSINEFIPRNITARVGEEVTWKLMGADHTVTFDVPQYFPIVEFLDDGEIRFNPRLHPPAGGSPPIPESEDEDGEILRVDGGTYDGDGFFSSGLFGGEPYAEYTLRFSKPGTYSYACLLHPPMVGTVKVT